MNLKQLLMMAMGDTPVTLVDESLLAHQTVCENVRAGYMLVEYDCDAYIVDSIAISDKDGSLLVFTYEEDDEE